jgi:hypothetical protein
MKYEELLLDTHCKRTLPWALVPRPTCLHKPDPRNFSPHHGALSRTMQIVEALHRGSANQARLDPSQLK